MDFIKNHKYTIILVLIILAVLVYAGNKWYEAKMNLVDQGLADSKFPFREYSLLELARQGKATEYNSELEEAIKNLPTRTTPQETFDKYIQALKDGDIEGAVECIEKDIDMDSRIGEYGHEWRVREGDKEYLYTIKERGYLDDMIEDLVAIESEIREEIRKIKGDSRGEWNVQYKYQCEWGDGICYFNVIKDFWGDWKITSPRL